MLLTLCTSENGAFFACVRAPRQPRTAPLLLLLAKSSAHHLLKFFCAFAPRRMDKWCARWSPTARGLFINKFQEWNISTPQHDWAAIIIVCCVRAPLFCLPPDKKQQHSSFSFLFYAFFYICGLIQWLCCLLSWGKRRMNRLLWLDAYTPGCTMSACVLDAFIISLGCVVDGSFIGQRFYHKLRFTLSWNKSKKFTCYKIQLCLSTKEESGYPWD